ncbi:MAG: tetratricopeptide repeat protein [Candidatus Eisenbacteria bacterium]
MPDDGHPPHDDLTRPPETFAPRPAHNAYARLPDRIGPFRILSLLGEGGMGRVYEAEQDSPRRTVALKVVKPGVATGEGLQRFERESQVLGRLQHPGIAAIYQAGTADAGQGPQPYFAMEFVRGHTLLDYAEAHKLDTRHRVELMARICDAVQHAHQKGVIHRDLKPGNLLVDEAGQPKVLDFGVARVTDNEMQATLRTDIGQLVGTIPYMSPEQVQGEPDAIDTRSDVYALGVVLYQLLTGRMPYSTERRSVPETLRAIAEDDPTPMSAVRRELRGDLDTIVARALAKERDQRYATAAELGADLRRFLHFEPILAHAPSTIYQLKKFARRNRVLVGGVAAVIVALALGLVVSLTQVYRATRAERLARTRLTLAQQRRQEAETARGAEAEQRQLAQQNAGRAASEAERAQSEARRAEEQTVRAQRSAQVAREEADKAKAVSGFLQIMLGAANPASATASDSARGRNVTVVEVLDNAAQRLDRGDLAAQPGVEAEARRTLGATYRELGAYDKAEPQLGRAVQLRSRHPGDGLELATSLEDLGWLRQAQHEPAGAESLFRRSLAIRRQHLAAADTLVIRSVGNLAVALQDQDRTSEAESLYREVLALETRRGAVAQRDRADALHNLGTLLQRSGKPKEGEPVLRAALSLRRRLLGDRNPDVANTLQSLAQARIALGDRAEGEVLLREAAETWGRALGEQHPDYATALANLGLLIRDEGRLAEAEPLLRRALDVGIAARGPDDATVGAMRYNYARLLQSEAKLAEAEPEFTRALASMEKTLPADHPSLAAARSGLGSIRTDLGRPADGEPLLREALATYRRLLPAGSWQVGQVGSVLGGNLAAQGRYAEAESLLVNGYTLLREHPSTPPDRKAMAVTRLVRLYEAWSSAAPDPTRSATLARWRATAAGADSARTR